MGKNIINFLEQVVANITDTSSIIDTSRVLNVDDTFNNNDENLNNKISTRKVTITVTNKIVGNYEARSYPDDDIDNDGLVELYEVPVFEILIEGLDDSKNARTIKHQAPRFMPFWNDPREPSEHYKARGWLNAGLATERTIRVNKYIRDYEVQNRFSPGRGAIVLKDYFYIHGGPSDISDFGFGSAGCIEIIGDYDTFKNNIKSLSGFKGTDVDDAISKLVQDKNLIVKIEGATAPDIKENFTKQVEL